MKNDSGRLKIIQILGGVLYGFAAAFTMIENHPDLSSVMGIILDMSSFFAAFLCAFWLQLILHEAGHLVFGLLSGYRFLSFRIGRFVLMKQKGKLRSGRYSLAGTSGQCLMAPPDYENGSYPTVMYNLGGVFMNLIFAFLFLIIRLKFHPSGFFNAFGNMMIACGLSMALTNGIPLKTDMVTNDGYNALHQKKEKETARTAWLMLKMMELQYDGIRLKDMDESLFETGDAYDLKNNGTAELLWLKENRAMDRQDFETAERLIGELLQEGTALSGLSRNLLELDRLYIDFCRSGSDADSSLLRSGEMPAFLKAMQDYPAVMRTLYADRAIHDDREKAAEIRRRFETIASSYPYPGEIETERDLMDHIMNQKNNGFR